MLVAGECPSRSRQGIPRSSSVGRRCQVMLVAGGGPPCTRRRKWKATGLEPSTLQTRRLRARLKPLCAPTRTAQREEGVLRERWQHRQRPGDHAGRRRSAVYPRRGKDLTNLKRGRAEASWSRWRSEPVMMRSALALPKSSRSRKGGFLGALRPCRLPCYRRPYTPAPLPGRHRPATRIE